MALAIAKLRSLRAARMTNAKWPMPCQSTPDTARNCRAKLRNLCVRLPSTTFELCFLARSG
eukprot:15445245-Alexandrium_andersonii.AAC.1